MKNPEAKLLTPLELEIMRVLWSRGASAVQDVLPLLEGKKLAYTTVSTVLRILEKKGVVTAEKVGRGHRYRAVVEREAYERVSVSHLVGKVFDGQAVSLVRRLLETEDLSPRELAELRALLEAKR